MDLPRHLFHVTAKSRLASIAREGLRAGSYWACSDSLVDYYFEVTEDEGEDAVVLRIDLTDLQQDLLCVDRPGIEEPITTALGLDEEQIAELWDGCAQGWRDSLEIIQSVRYMGVVPAQRLVLMEGGDPIVLLDHVCLLRAA